VVKPMERQGFEVIDLGVKNAESGKVFNHIDYDVIFMSAIDESKHDINKIIYLGEL
jgi:hypothetical protein